MKTKVDVLGAQIEPSSIDSISADSSISGRIDSATIGEISGDVKLNSSLQDGKLYS